MSFAENPDNAYKNADLDYAFERSLKPAVSQDTIIISDYKQCRSRIDLAYTILEKGGAAQNYFVELPLYHFPGYKAFFNGTEPLAIETGTNFFMRIYLPVSEKSGTIKLRYTGLPRFFFAYAVSLLTFAFLIMKNRKRLFVLGIGCLSVILQSGYASNSFTVASGNEVILAEQTANLWRGFEAVGGGITVMNTAPQTPRIKSHGA
jgi:hypothetical protein